MQLTTLLLLRKPCKLFASVARVCQRQLGFLVGLNRSVVLGSSARQQSEGSCDALSLGDVKIPMQYTIKSLGVIIGSNLTFSQQFTTSTASAIGTLPTACPPSYSQKHPGRSCYFHCVINTRLDYCNSVLLGTSKSNKLQRVELENSLAQTVTSSRLHDHITPILARLHWLPIAQHIEFKVNLLTFKTHSTYQPDYL